MCTWTENHYILFSSADYLMGQLYPNEIFHNSGQTGQQKMQAARQRVMRWLDLRYQTGFSEWLSNVYYEETMTGLINLADFAHDSEIANKAAIVLDLMLADMALNQFQGTFGSTHGRSYHRHKIDGARENTGVINKLLFGTNRFRPGSMAAVALAVSPRYQMPTVLYHMANDSDRPEFENRQRMSIRLKEANARNKSRLFHHPSRNLRHWQSHPQLLGRIGQFTARCPNQKRRHRPLRHLNPARSLLNPQTHLYPRLVAQR
jgi:hypothetical protein